MMINPKLVDKHFILSDCKFLSSLQVLNVSHNLIKYIDGEIFKDFSHLKYLDLSNNQITFLPDQTFSAMSRLESIKINNNSLTTIDDDVFLDLKLNHLDLSCNRLSDDNFLWPAVNIDYLNLTLNDYKEINASVLENVMTDLWGESLYHL